MNPTAREMAAAIVHATGVSPRSETVDTFKSGNPDDIVRGVAVTMMPSLEVLRRAAAMDCNFVIAHEPLFYGHLDDTRELAQENDAIWNAKRAFIEEHELIVWRYHDYPHLQNPDAILSGMVEELGWREFQDRDSQFLFDLPPTTLGDLARTLGERLEAPTLRVVGNPDQPIRRVALSPGCPGFEAPRHLLQIAGVEALIIGEAREWETVAYAADALDAGMNKSLIVTGHITSEQGGMKAIARGIAALVPSVPVHFVPSREPLWSPV